MARRADKCVCDHETRCAFHANQVEPIMHALAAALHKAKCQGLSSAYANDALAKYDAMEAARD